MPDGGEQVEKGRWEKIERRFNTYVNALADISPDAARGRGLMHPNMTGSYTIRKDDSLCPVPPEAQALAVCSYSGIPNPHVVAEEGEEPGHLKEMRSSTFYDRASLGANDAIRDECVVAGGKWFLE
jgi:hypothetical protein